MIKIEAIVREEKLEDIKSALNEVEVHGLSISQIMGCGIQKGYTEVIRGTKVDFYMLPKIKFEIVVSDEHWEKITIEAIKKAAFTENPGDGKIFSYDLRNAWRIRTGETGTSAINPTSI